MRNTNVGRPIMNFAVATHSGDPSSSRRSVDIDSAPILNNLPATTNQLHAPVTRIGPWTGGEPDTVFLHGLLSSPAIWKGLSQPRDPLNAIAISLPGHFPWNTSSSDTKELLMDFAFIDEYRIRIRELTDRKVRLVAHSTGALVALKIAARWPDLVEGVVLFGAFACGKTSATRSLAANAVTLPVAGSSLFRLLYDLWLHSPGLYEKGLATAMANGCHGTTSRLHELAMLHDLRRSDPEALRTVIQWLQGISVSSELQDVSVPVTVVVGALDPVVSADEQMKLAQSVRNASAIICNFGHLPMFEAPELVRRLIRQPGWISSAG